MTAIRICPETDSVCEFQSICHAKHCFGLYSAKTPCGGKTGSELGPVRTVTRKEIVPGTYGPDGGLNIEMRDDQSEAFINMDDWYKAAEIREFARLLNEIADAMEEQS